MYVRLLGNSFYKVKNGSPSDHSFCMDSTFFLYFQINNCRFIGLNRLNVVLT